LKGKRIIACEVFRDALRYFNISQEDIRRKILFLPSHLHLRPSDLKDQMLDRLEPGTEKTRFAGCLYGQCFPDIDSVLSERGIQRITCGNCYQILMGGNAYQRLTAEEPGSFFMEKTLIEDFDNLCRIPLELDDPQMRDWTFEHYRQVVYIRQPLDPPLMDDVRNVAEYLSLDIRVVEADYSELLLFLKRMDLL
jgi:hypothetical protein